ncbi:amino acid transporter [Rhizophagus irregularis]|uniref:Amino acid transporter n=1 Tax=Rhizophagus irregularis TaxID=588596 RepID=A0A2N1N4H1_9GLOM|nr:amino acid transporter [Rhizophagus irregularis]
MANLDENNQGESMELLGVIYGIGMNVNNIIGVGIFTTPGIVWKQVKTPHVVILLWLAGGIVSLFGSLIYTEYGALHRDNGGEKIYLEKAYPSPPLMASYLFSFMFIFVIRPVIICAVLQSAAQYTWYMFVGTSPLDGDDKIDPLLNGWQNKFKPYWILKLIAIFFLLLITGYHLLNRKLANKINHGLAITKMIVILVIALGGISKYHNNENWKKPLDDNSINTAVNSYPIAIIQILFSYNGWNTLNYSLDEFRNPEVKLKLSNISSIVIVTILYLLANVAFITALPSDVITKTEHFNETITADFFKSIFFDSSVAARVLSLFVVLSAVGTAATSVWSGSRVIVSAAKKNFFPIFSPQLVKWREREINQQGQRGENMRYTEYTPVNALLAQLVWCIFIILIVGGSIQVDSFVLFTSIATFSVWISYIVTSCGLVKTRKRYPGNSPFKVPRSIIHLFIVSGFLFIAISFVPDKESIHPYIVQISFILVSSDTTATDTTATDTTTTDTTATDTTATDTTATDTTTTDTTATDTAATDTTTTVTTATDTAINTTAIVVAS